MSYYGYPYGPYSHRSDHESYHSRQSRRPHRDANYYDLPRNNRHVSRDDFPTPASHSWLDGARKPGPTDTELAVLKDRGLSALKDEGLTEHEATKLAMDALKDHRRRHIEALSGSHFHARYPKRDLPFRVFNEIDHEFFRGVLKGHVYMKWADLPQNCHGVTSRPGKNNFSRITIELNQRFLRNSDTSWCREGVLAALFHQMTHAYFLVCCGFRNPEVPLAKYDLGHGLGFCTLLHQIQTCLQLEPTVRFPSLFTCINSGARAPVSRAERPPSSTGGNLGSSQCVFAMNEVLPHNVCMDHYRGLPAVMPKEGSKKEGENKSDATNPYPIARYLHGIDLQNCTPKPFLRSEYTVPHSEYVELHFDGQAYPVPRTKINLHPSLRVKLQQIQGSPKCLPVPASSFEEFLSLISFLERGDYPPDISEVKNFPMRNGIAKGPPRIEEFKSDGKPYLITDIRAYSIAKKTGFEELRKKALDRLHGQAFTHNDPMEALEEIYDRLEPSARDNDLRGWVCQWLLVNRFDDRGEGSTNLEFLSTDSQWKERFVQLRNKGGAFLEDFDTVQRELARWRGFSNSCLSLLCAGSNAGNTSDSSGGSSTPMYAPTPVQSPTFRDSLPTRNYPDYGPGWMPSRAQTPYWPAQQYGQGWGQSSNWTR